MRTGNGQANALHVTQRAQAKMDSASYDQLSRLNDKLADLQRELAHKNTELERLKGQIQRYADKLEAQVQERVAQLQAEYARLETVLHSTSDGIIVANGSGEILHANPVVQGWLTHTLSLEEAKLLEEAVRDLAARASERPKCLLELKGLDLEMGAAPAVGSMNGPTVVVAIHDVSHLKALDRMKSSFITNISHELRTPVTAMKLYMALMQRQPEKWKDYLHPLIQETERLVLLVEDVLQISRLDARQVEMKPVPVCLDELVGITAEKWQALAQRRGLTLEHQLAEAGPIVLVDADLMLQVMDNLVENAILYTPAGGRVVISIDREKVEGQIWATVTVTDSGVGIPEDELPHVFDRFFRGEKPRDMQVSGTGLGLAIAKTLVEAHRGSITVTSEMGRGSTFTIRLPLVGGQSQRCVWA